MPDTVPQPADRCPLPTSESRPRMAKASLRNADAEGWRTRIGQAMERVQSRSGWSLKEFAAQVQRDERQVARWFSGAEHAQLAAIYAVAALRPLLLVALAELDGASVEIETNIKIRKVA